MKPIFSSYLIHEGNNALLPAKHTDYNTIVLSTNEKIYVNRNPLQVIKDSCYRDFASYEGRKDAIKHLTNYSHKLPIPISTSRHIYAFPTMSPLNLECIWLFFNRIKEIKAVKSTTGNYRSIVQFVDGSSLPLDISYHTMTEQYERTKHCIELHEKNQHMFVFDPDSAVKL